MISGQVLTERPRACNFAISWPYGTQSNAFDKSIAMVTKCFCYQRPHAKASLIIEWRADCHEPDDRPVYTVFYIQRFVEGCNILWLRNHNKSHWRHRFNTYAYGCNALALKYGMVLPLCMKTFRNTLLLREAMSEDVKYPKRKSLTHWDRVTHICVCKLTIFGSDNGMSPGRRQAIIWTNARVLLIGPWEQTLMKFFYRNLHIFIQENPFQNMVWNVASILSRPQCVYIYYFLYIRRDSSSSIFIDT